LSIERVKLGKNFKKNITSFIFIEHCISIILNENSFQRRKKFPDEGHTSHPFLERISGQLMKCSSLFKNSGENHEIILYLQKLKKGILYLCK